MQAQGSVVEVLGVPDVLAADRMNDKLQIHFLSKKHGGRGELLDVLYPWAQPGQAFIIFPRPEVAAQVLQKSPHVLELDHQKYPLTVKTPEVNPQVEATVHLNRFQDETEVQQILRSHGFEMTDQGGGQVKVKGSFFQLKAVKLHLEQLAEKPQTDTTPYSSSGDVSNRCSDNTTRGRSRYRDKPPHASPSSPATSTFYTSVSSYSCPTSEELGKSSTPPHHRASVRPGSESFVVNTDVFVYAGQFKKKEITTILNSHGVEMKPQHVDGSTYVTVLGSNSRRAVGQLQSLLHPLNESLRIQEVQQRDIGQEGRVLLERIQRDRHIYKSVLVREMNDRLHLIGPSKESFELKQRLQDSRWRSRSLPAHFRNKKERTSEVVADPSPAGAAGYSAVQYQDKKEEGDASKQEAAALQRQGTSLRRRSQSESREKKKMERLNGQARERENKQQPQKSPSKFTQPLMNLSLNIKQQFKKRNK